MLNYLKTILKFFNLLSYNNKLSLTNILFYVATVLFILHPQLETISGLLLAVLNYSHKRHVDDLRNTTEEATSKRITTVEVSLQKIVSDVDVISTTVGDVNKTMQELSDKMGTISVGMGMNATGGRR